MDKEDLKKKIQWYCYQLHIATPKVWDYKNVKKVTSNINTYSGNIIICRDCGKIDVSYPHTECDYEYVQYKNQNLEHYD